MHGKLRAAALVGATALFTTMGPIEEPAPSAETLAMLDPIRQASAMCGSKSGFAALAQRLRLAGILATPAHAAMQGPVPLLDTLGGLDFPVTANAAARPYFQQGLMLVYGFNHGAAVRSFKEAQRLDPDCAMCWWGEALAYGPNINAPMDPSSIDATLAAVARARALKGNASAMEQALIDALALRYVADVQADRAPLDMAYAEAMLAAAAQFPDDDDVAVLAAEAVMDTTPWNYWQADRRTPNGRIGDAVMLVERVLARRPDHPQAAHLYIHLMENYAVPARAEAAADRLARPLVPGAGHLVHMPGHIYYRLGRFADSIRSNVLAARVDEAYVEASGDNGLYRFGYYPHNVHFIVTSAQMAGDIPTAIREAQRLGKVVSADVAAQIAWIQPVNAAPYLAYAQVGSPDQILALAAPDDRLPYVTAMYHYARAVAEAQRSNRSGFRREIAALRKLREDTDFEAMTAQGVPAPDLLTIAETVALARYATARRRYKDAADLYREAIALEDTIPYTEPPYWYYPIRQSLGAALFQAGRYEEARQAFREALVRSPANGWALYGLAQTEDKLGNRLEAAAARDALDRAWLGDSAWLRMERL